MKLSTKKFSKETIKKYTVQSKLPLSNIQTLDWNPNLNKTQRKAVVKEVKRLLAGSVVYFSEALLPDKTTGVAYLTPFNVFWQGNSLCVSGEFIFIHKDKAVLSVFKTCETNYVIPEIVVHTVTYQDFTDMLGKRYKQLTPKAKL